MRHPPGMPDVFSDPELHGGQPVVESGIPIYLISDMLAQQFSPEEMRRDYGITEEHVHIALRFAAEYMKREGSDVASSSSPKTPTSRARCVTRSAMMASPISHNPRPNRGIL